MSSQTLTLTLTAADGATQNLTVPYPAISGSTTAVQFPLLGNYAIGAPFDFDLPPTQHYLAQMDVSILGMYLNWTGATDSNPALALSQIRALNPKTLLGQYCCFCPVGNTNPAEKTYAKTQKGPGGIGDWMAYYANGTAVSTGTLCNGNTTLLVTPDANGYHLPEYCAHYDYSPNGMLSTSGGAAPVFDVWFSDDNFYQPRVAADWNRSGTTNYAANSTQARSWWRAGQAAYYAAANAIKPPGMIFMVNADSNLGSTNACGNGWSHSLGSEYQNLMGGALLEALIGEGWSVEANYGTAGMMNWYLTTFANLVAPQMVIFNHHWASPGTAAGYQDARYGLAACLMSNGYFSLTDMGNYAPYPGADYWLDEFTAGATYTSPASSKWLGTAVDPPQTTSWSQGVWMRRYANGLALMNPKGNGSQTVTPPSGYKHFTGSQAPTVNNGATVTGTVTLADRDGLLLVKM
jgi:hypothetical protein